MERRAAFPFSACGLRGRRGSCCDSSRTSANVCCKQNAHEPRCVGLQLRQQRQVTHVASEIRHKWRCAMLWVRLNASAWTLPAPCVRLYVTLSACVNADVFDAKGPLNAKSVFSRLKCSIQSSKNPTCHKDAGRELVLERAQNWQSSKNRTLCCEEACWKCHSLEVRICALADISQTGHRGRKNRSRWPVWPNSAGRGGKP